MAIFNCYVSSPEGTMGVWNGVDVTNKNGHKSGDSKPRMYAKEVRGYAPLLKSSAKAKCGAW